MKNFPNIVFYCVFLCISMSCCMGATVDCITFDYWRWDKGYVYHIVLDEHKGYMSKKSLEGCTDSIQSPIIIPYEKVGNLYEYATKSYICQDSTPPYQKKKADRYDYHMPMRLEIVIRCGRQCIKDTLFIPTIDDYEYDYSDYFKKLMFSLSKITDDLG